MDWGNIFLTVLGLFASAIAFLFKLNESKNAKAIAKLEERADKCEKERAEMRKKIATLEAKLNAYKDKNQIQA